MKPAAGRDGWPLAPLHTLQWQVKLIDEGPVAVQPTEPQAQVPFSVAWPNTAAVDACVDKLRMQGLFFGAVCIRIAIGVVEKTVEHAAATGNRLERARTATRSILVVGRVQHRLVVGSQLLQSSTGASHTWMGRLAHP